MDLSASPNDIQAPQDEANKQDADLREVFEELIEACTAAERETTKLNGDLIRLRELRDEREAVEAFIETVPSRLNCLNERFRDDLNTLVTTHTTDMNITTEIWPTVDSASQAQEAAHTHV